MLYDQWRQIAAARRDELALLEIASGDGWTFARLFTAGEQWGRSSESDPVAFPQGNSPEFVLTILSAWRDGKVVCPLESSGSPPILRLPLPGDCIHLKTTSATTGPALGVAFTPEQLAADAENIFLTMGLRPDWPNLGVISLAHSYGFSNLVLPLLLHGIPLILAPAPLPEAVRRSAADFPALTLAGVPALWRAWQAAGAIPPSVRLAISAGAPLPLSLEQAVFAEAGLKIHNFYGSTECGGIAYDTMETPRTVEACVGSALRQVDLSVSATGCLNVRSRAVGTTYWPTAKQSLEHGHFQTSDLAELKDGLVYLRGRASDQINVAGRKVSPETIEQVLLRHPQVRDCVVFGVPSRDTERAEEIVAVIVSPSPVAELRQVLVQTLPAWQMPRHWRIVDSLQTGSRGKVSRALWRERWLAEHPS